MVLSYLHCSVTVVQAFHPLGRDCEAVPVTLDGCGACFPFVRIPDATGNAFWEEPAWGLGFPEESASHSVTVLFFRNYFPINFFPVACPR